MMLQKLYKTSMLFIAALVAMIVWASEEAYAISTPQVTMNNDFANQNATYRIEFTETYASIQKFEIKFPPGTDLSRIQQSDIEVYHKNQNRAVESFSVSGTTLNFVTEYNPANGNFVIIISNIGNPGEGSYTLSVHCKSIGDQSVYGGETESSSYSIVIPNSPPTVVGGEEVQSGNATPPSRDGQTEGDAYTADVSAWFEDADAADVLSYSVVSAKDADDADVSGDVSIAGNNLTYLPNAAQGGKQVTIVVRAYDGEDYSTSNVTITVNVGATPNSAPAVKAGADTQAGIATPESRDNLTPAVPYTADASAWFEDLDGNALTYSVESATDAASTDVSGDVTMAGSSITYAPQAAQANQSVMIVVKANDGTVDSADTVTVTVNVGAAPNSAPIVKAGEGAQTGTATPQSRDGLAAAVPYTADVSAWFEDLDGDALTYSVVSATDAASTDVSSDVSMAGSSITYAPQAAQASQPVTIIVRSNDGAADSAGTVMITVNVGAIPNSAPNVVDGQASQYGVATPSSRDGQTAAVSYTADVSAWFEDLDGNALTYSVESATDAASTDVSGDVTMAGNNITYTPQTAQASQSVMIVVRSNDGTVDSADTVTITVNVGAIPNSAPIVKAGEASQTGIAKPAAKSGNPKAVSYTADVSGWFEDLDGDVLTYSVVSATDAASADVSGDVTIAGSGIAYTPKAAQANQVVTIQIKANDGHADSMTVTIAVTVGEVPADASAVLQKIQGYAGGNADDLTIEELTHAGVVGAIPSNLHLYKAAIEAADEIADLDALQAIIDAVNVLEKIKGYAGGNAGNLEIADLVAAGIIGAIADNLDKYREAIEAVAEIADLSELQAIIDNVNAQEALTKIRNAAGHDASGIGIADLEMAGVTGADPARLDTYKSALEQTNRIDNLADLQSVIDVANEIQDTIDALEQLIKRHNHNLSAVQSDLNLVTGDANGTTVSWITSDPGVVAADGVVTRPGAGQPDATVTLIATVSKNGIQIDSEITVTVKARTPSRSEPPAQEVTGPADARPVEGISIGGNDAIPQDLVEIKRTVTDDEKTIDRLEVRLESIRPFLKADDPDARQITIAIGKSEDDELADETHIVIPGASLKMLQDEEWSLKVVMAGIIVEFNEETFRTLQMADEDLMLKVIPIVEGDELREIQERAAEYDGNRIAMGTSYRIETNYTGQTRVEFSIARLPLPDNPFARLKMLESLGVYVEYADGSASLLQGKVIYNRENEPVGLEIWADGSGTFTIVAAPVDYVEFQVGSAIVISGNQTQQMDVTPYVLEDQTMVPLRYASEAMSWQVEWLPETRQARLIGDDLTILLTIDSAEISVIKASIEQSVSLKAAVQLHEERTFVPMHFFRDVTETEVHWDETGAKITILY